MKKLTLPLLILFGIMSPTIVCAEVTEASERLELTEAEALATDAKQYAASYNVSIEEAMKRLTVMHGLQSQVDAIASEEGDSYAGSYFDNSEQFGLVIRTTKQEKANKKLIKKANHVKKSAEMKAEEKQQRKLLRDKLKLNEKDITKAENIINSDIVLDVRYKGEAKQSLKQLQKSLKNNQNKLSEVPGLLQNFIDEKNGEIVFLIQSQNEQEQKDAISKIINVPFRVENIPDGFQFTAARGGQSLELNNRRFCTSGFVANRTRDNVKGMVIAGHCSSNNSTLSIKDSGGAYIPLTVDASTVQNPELNSSAVRDLAFFAASPSDQNKMVGEFYADAGVVRKVTATATKSQLAVSNGDEWGVKGTTVGSYLCHFGQTSLGSATYKQSCGEVISTNGSALSGTKTRDGIKQTGNYVILRNTQSGKGTTVTSGDGTLSCFVGDSGGPVFALTTAYGIQSACAWNGTPNQAPVRYLAYTSIEDVSTLGVTIVK